MRGAPHQRLGELGYIERGNLGPVAAQAGQRAGIALALRGFELDFIIVAEPQFGLPVGGLAQRRQFDLLDGPAGLLQPLGGIPDRGLDLRNGFQTVGRDIHRHPLRHRRPFQRRRHPPGIAHILTRHRRQRDPEIADGARQRARDRATLRRKPPFRYRCVARRDPAGGRPQSVNAAGIGRKADRARDVGAMRDMTDAGRDRGPGAAGRPARRDRGIARVLGVAMNEIGGEPAIGKSRAIGAAEDHRARFAQVIDHRRILARDVVALQIEAIGIGITRLIDIDLHRYRYAGQRPERLVARDRSVDFSRLRQHILGPVIDHRVEGRVDRVEPRQRRFRHLPGRDFFEFDCRRNIGRRQAPEIFHQPLRLIARLYSVFKRRGYRFAGRKRVKTEG